MFANQFHSGFRFTVSVNDIEAGAFTECTLPSLQVETLDIKEGGQNAYVHKLPVRVSAGTLTLRHGIVKGSALFQWYMLVLNGHIDKAMRQVTITMYDVSHAPLATWNFRDAYPVKWTGPTLKSDDNAVAIESIEIVHHGFEAE